VVSQFATYGSEDACSSGLSIVIDKHGGVFVESDVATVGATTFFACSHYDTANDFTLFDAGARNSIFNSCYEHITY
jgi:hypothetical protein